jgi:hypothetical protein
MFLEKQIFFLDSIIQNVLRDLPFRRNQPLKSADDVVSGILKKYNKIKTYDILHELKTPR